VDETKAADATKEEPPPLENVAIVVPEVPSALAKPRAADPHRESVLVYLASLHTLPGRRTAIGALRRIARILGVDPEGVDRNCWQRVPWCNLGARETTYIQAKLEANGAAPNTTKLTMTILRQVHWHAFRLGHMSGDAYARAKTTKVHGSKTRVGRELTREVIEAVSKAIGQRETPLREMSAAAWGLGITCGLRREEFVRLTLGSVRDGGRVLHVIGKGRKERLQDISPRVRGVLWAWLAVRKRLELTTDALFPRWRDGKVQDEPASVDSMWRFLKHLQDGSGVEPFSPHDMRRTFGTASLRKHDVKVVQGMMGHENPSTTFSYDRRGEDEMKRLREKALGDLDKEWGDAIEAAAAGPEDDLKIFTRGGQQYTKGWVKEQLRLLEAKGLSREAAVAALVKVGVTRHGRAIEEGDLA
jgi:integrase